MGVSSGASSPKVPQECKFSQPTTHLLDVCRVDDTFPRDTSVTDPWARMISYHFLNQTTRDNFFTNNSAHGAGQLWSTIPHLQSWQRYQLPFPIIQANSRPVGSNLTTALSPTSAVYEVNRVSLRPSTPLVVCHLSLLVIIQITPMEWGSWDPQLSAMMNMSYAGTHLTDGQPDNDTACVTGFDDTGFMMGTSASLFNVSPFIDGSILMVILVPHGISKLLIISTIPYNS